MKPEFAKAAELMRTDETPVAFAKVDCTEAGKETCSKFSVSGYPTLKIFRNGEVSTDYNGPREAGEYHKTFSCNAWFYSYLLQPVLLST